MNFLRKNAVCIQICPFFAVRPDRDLTGKQKVPRARKRVIDEELINHMVCGNSTFIPITALFCIKYFWIIYPKIQIRLKGDEWSKKLSVEFRMLLMQLLNIESKVAKGDQRDEPLPKLPSEKLYEKLQAMATSSFPSKRDVGRAISLKVKS